MGYAQFFTLEIRAASFAQTYSVGNVLDQYPIVDGQILTWDGCGGCFTRARRAAAP